MLSEGTRRFDLYDFFSVLLPGATFLIGIAPFLPADTNLFSVGGIAGAIVLGFAVGRALHAVGLFLESPEKETLTIGGFGLSDLGVAKSHREKFVSELKDPRTFSEELIDEFYRAATDTYSDLNLPSNRDELSENNEVNNTLETLYVLARAHIHIDSRGRSRTFQAVLDFQRTIMMSVFFLFLIYLTYSAILYRDSGGIVGYESYISTLEVEIWLVSLLPSIILVGALLTFERVRSSYREYFLQYLMADFITLYHASDDNKSKADT